MRTQRLSLALVVASLSACMPSATLDTSTVAAPEPASAQRRYARLSGDLTLYADPSTLALQVQWVADAPVVELLEDRDGFWQVRTLLPREVMALGFDASASLDVLTLIAWVDQRSVVEFEPAPGSARGSTVASSEAAPPPRFSSRNVVVTYPFNLVPG